MRSGRAIRRKMARKRPWERSCIVGGRGRCPGRTRREREVRELPSWCRFEKDVLFSGILHTGRSNSYVPVQHEYDAISQSVLEINMLLKLKDRLQRRLLLLEDQNSGSRSTVPDTIQCRIGKSCRIRVPLILRAPHPNFSRISKDTRMKLVHIVMDIRIIRLRNC